MSTEIHSTLPDVRLHCCTKCKGLFRHTEEGLKHQLTCTANPFKSPCTYFACERKIFLQLFQPEDFEMEGSFHPLNMSKDDSFINHFVKIRMPDVFDPSIFFRTSTQTLSNQHDSGDTSFLLDENITTLETDPNKSTCDPYISGDKELGSIEQRQIQNIISKNIAYLKNAGIPPLVPPTTKTPHFSSSQSESRLLSPIDKHLNFLDETKSRGQSPFEKCAGFLNDHQFGYQGSGFNYASNPSIPFSCNLATDLLSNLTQGNEDAQQPLLTNNIEECPNLQYLDLAKKDPFLGQHPGLQPSSSQGQLNARDPFLINAGMKTDRPASMTSQLLTNQRIQTVKSSEDIQSQASPNFNMQESNYFTFPSTLDEPTQLDYLDLATLDFLTNPNFTFNSTSNPTKDKACYGKEDDIYSENNLVYLSEQTSVHSAETAARVDNLVRPNSASHDKGRYTKRKSRSLRLKKSKSDLGKPNKSCFLPIAPASDFSYVSAMETPLSDKDLETVYGRYSPVEEVTAVRPKRKRKMSESRFDRYRLMPKENVGYASKRLCKSNKIFNVSEQLTGFTDEEKARMKAVFGRGDCIFVKKQIGENQKPVVVVEDIPASIRENLYGQVAFVGGGVTLDGKTDQSRESRHGSETEKEQKLTSVLKLKCKDCDFSCSTAVELKDHCFVHKSEAELAVQVIAEPCVENGGFDPEVEILTAVSIEASATAGHNEPVLQPRSTVNSSVISEVTREQLCGIGSAVPCSDNTKFEIATLGCNETGVPIITCDNYPVQLTSGNSYIQAKIHPDKDLPSLAGSTSAIEAVLPVADSNQSNPTIISIPLDSSLPVSISTVDNDTLTQVTSEPYRSATSTENSIANLSFSVCHDSAQTSTTDNCPEIIEITIADLIEPENCQSTSQSNVTSVEKFTEGSDPQSVNVLQNSSYTVTSYSQPVQTALNDIESIDQNPILLTDPQLQSIPDGEHTHIKTTIFKAQDDGIRFANDIGQNKNSFSTSQLRKCSSLSSLLDHDYGSPNTSDNEKQAAPTIQYKRSYSFVETSSPTFSDMGFDFVSNVQENSVESFKFPLATDIGDKEQSSIAYTTTSCLTQDSILPCLPTKSGTEIMNNSSFDPGKEKIAVGYETRQNPSIAGLSMPDGSPELKIDSTFQSAEGDSQGSKGEERSISKQKDGYVMIWDGGNSCKSAVYVSTQKKSLPPKPPRSIPEMSPSNAHWLKSRSVDDAALLKPSTSWNPEISLSLKRTLDTYGMIVSDRNEIPFKDAQPISTNKLTESLQKSPFNGLHKSGTGPKFTILKQKPCLPKEDKPQPSSSQVTTNGTHEPDQKIPGVYRCGECSYTTTSSSQIFDHRAKHTGLVYKCLEPGCQFQSMYKRNLDQHWKVKHTESDIVYACETCSYTTPEKKAMTRHQQQHHQKEKRFKCTDCDYATTYRSDVVKHYQNMHIQQKLFACNQCDYKTSYVHRLKLHLMAHAGIRPYKCSKCDYQVNDPGKVTRHIRAKHKGDVDVSCEKLDLEFEIDAKQFQCEEKSGDQEIKVIELTKEEQETLKKKHQENNGSKSETRKKNQRKGNKVSENCDVFSKNQENIRDSIVFMKADKFV